MLLVLFFVLLFFFTLRGLYRSIITTLFLIQQGVICVSYFVYFPGVGSTYIIGYLGYRCHSQRGGRSCGTRGFRARVWTTRYSGQVGSGQVTCCFQLSVLTGRHCGGMGGGRPCTLDNITRGSECSYPKSWCATKTHGKRGVGGTCHGNGGMSVVITRGSNYAWGYRTG